MTDIRLINKGLSSAGSPRVIASAVGRFAANGIGTSLVRGVCSAVGTSAANAIGSVAGGLIGSAHATSAATAQGSGGGGAGSSTTLVQKKGGSSPLSANIVTSLNVATTAGNTILIFANGAGTIATPSGFSSRSPQVNDQGCYLFEKLVASGNSSDTPTLVMGGAYNATWEIAEYSGITAIDASTGNNANSTSTPTWATPTVTPAAGNKLLVGFVVATAQGTASTFTAGDPQSWTNSFTGQQSNTQPGGSGAGNDSITGGWASLTVTADGVTAYSVAAALTSSSGNYFPASIIAAYTASAGGTGTVTHGDQLTVNNVGPWSLQGVAKGSESLDTVAAPGRGYWQMDIPSEWAPTGTYVYNNIVSNKGGIVPAGGLTIDGFLYPAGTVVCQFRNLSATDFSAQGMSGHYLFRGCRFRQNGVGDPSQFNDFTATYTNALHYCDMGGLSANNADANAPFWKMLGGTNHICYRNYMTYQKVALQPNTPNFQCIENYIDKVTFFWGPAGPSGGGGPNHTAAIGCEGGGTGFRIMRNRIVIPSPDDAGNIIENGASLAMEGTNGSTYSDCQVVNNYIAGANYAFLAFGERAGQTNLVVTGNKFTTQWWTGGGISGILQAGPFPVPWGSNGNVKSNNIFADDYGTGGTGIGTPLSSRQYPTGNGPLKGTLAF